MAAGWASWSGHLELIPLAAVALLLWRYARSRPEAAGVGLAYYAGAAQGLPAAATVFFVAEGGGRFEAFMVVVLAVVLCAAPWALLWSLEFRSSTRTRLERAALLGAALFLPPLGLVSFANPFVATATLFPGVGLLGVVIALLVLFAPQERIWVPVLTVACILSVTLTGRNATAANSFTGVSTELGPLSVRDGTEVYRDTQALLRGRIRTDERPLLLPEAVGGFADGLGARVWSEGLEDRHAPVVVGMLETDARGTRRSGVMVFEGEEHWFWPQRIPAPFGMWAPWAEHRHVSSELLQLGVKRIGERRVGLAVCFEQFVSWPLFQSALFGAGTLLAPANLWFDRNGRLHALRDASLFSWGAVMGWQTVGATNV